MFKGPWAIGGECSERSAGEDVTAVGRGRVGSWRVGSWRVAWEEADSHPLSLFPIRCSPLRLHLSRPPLISASPSDTPLSQLSTHAPLNSPLDLHLAFPAISPSSQQSQPPLPFGSLTLTLTFPTLRFPFAQDRDPPTSTVTATPLIARIGVGMKPWNLLGMVSLRLFQALSWQEEGGGR